MPVKNVKRKTNDGFEGVITGLNDKEKEIISNSIVEANPSTEATETLNKLRIGDATYNVGVENIKANGTYTGEEAGMIINSFNLTSEQREKIKNGNVMSISGDFALSNGETSYGVTYIGSTHSEDAFAGTNLSTSGDNMTLTINVFAIPKDESMDAESYLFEFLMIPSLPSDASSKTYTLRSVNGTLAWVDTSVGTQYFEDINVGGVSLDDKINSAINSAITSTLEANY